MSATRRAVKRDTAAVKGVAAEVRAGGFTWKAVVRHLGGGGTDYYRFNGKREDWFQSDIPTPIYRKLRRAINPAIRVALGRP